MVIRKIMDEDFDRFLSNVEKSIPSDKSTIRPAKSHNVISNQSFESSGARQTTKPGQSAIDSDLAEILGSGSDNKRRIPSRTIAPSASSNQTSNSKTEKSRGSNFDDLLRDLNDVRLEQKSSSHSSRHNSDISFTSVPRSNSISSKTCFQLFLVGAGGDSRVGYSSASDPQVGCAVLRCLDCDFIVEQFENACWPEPPAVEYLFFRNQMPDRDALSQRLKRSPGARAYCCQCKWVSMRSGSRPLTIAAARSESGEALRWACAKRHS